MVLAISLMAMAALAFVDLGLTFPQFEDEDEPIPLDSDGDGFPDHLDPYPFDHDNDGFDDIVDLVPTFDAAIRFSLTHAAVYDQVDFFSNQGQIYFLLYLENKQIKRFPESGTWSFQLGVKYSLNQVWAFNVPDDVRYHNIRLEMWDQDALDDDLIDIDPSSRSGRALNIRYDIQQGATINGHADGRNDGTHRTDDDDGAVWYRVERVEWAYNRAFEWRYGTGVLNTKMFTLDFNVCISNYVNYTQDPIERWPSQSQQARVGKTMVTVNDTTVVMLASELDRIAAREGYNRLQKANFVLKFVQSIEYQYDNVSKGQNEYWKYPVETLFEGNGDCEDTAILYAALMRALGYDCVLILVPGHCAVALAVDGASGWRYTIDGRSYFYCETTNPSWSVGAIPEAYKGESARIIRLN